MKLFLASSVLAIGVASAMFIVSSNRHDENCQRLQLLQQSKDQSRAEIGSWDQQLSASRARSLGIRPMSDIEATYPETCQPFDSGMALTNAILSALLVFAALFVPPTLLRGFFNLARGNHR